MKLLAFAASNSRQSINKQLATYAAFSSRFDEIEILDIHDYELPIFSIEREQELGQPHLAKEFFAKLGAADAIIVSFAEYNGSYTSAYKNLFDWVSRIDQKLFQNKPMLMLATSPGPGGAQNVLAAAVNSAPYFAGNVIASLSVASFFDNFDSEQQRLSDDKLSTELSEALQNLLQAAQQQVEVA